MWDRPVLGGRDFFFFFFLVTTLKGEGHGATGQTHVVPHPFLVLRLFCAVAFFYSVVFFLYLCGFSLLHFVIELSCLSEGLLGAIYCLRSRIARAPV